MRKKITILTGILTGAICIIMNFVLIPKIEADTNGIRCFDMNFTYSYETAVKFLSLLSETGKHIYLHYQLPLDFFYPVAYCIFFCLLIYTLSRGRKVLLIFPLAMTMSDYTENICIYKMLTSEQLSAALIRLSSIATSIKTVLLYITIIITVICLIYYLKTKKRISAEDA